MTTYRISELASRTGTRPATLRFYEHEGLLPAGRSPAGYRLYEDDAVERLDFIGAAKRLGLPLAEIRDLLGVWDVGECADVRDHLRPLLEARIADSRHQVAELAAFTARLMTALARLHAPAVAGRCEPGCCIPVSEVPADDVPADDVPADDVPADDVPVPVIEGCALPDASRAGRVREWHDLLARARHREAIAGGVRLHLPLATTPQAAALAAAETQCCTFFTFTLHISRDGALLDIRAPRERLFQLSAIVTG